MTKAMLYLAVAAAWAADPPQMKDGLWSVHTVTTENPGDKKSDQTFSMCRNQAYDKAVREAAKTNQKGCTWEEKFEPGKFIANSHCVVGATTIESKGTTTFSSDTAAHAETHATYTPPMAGMAEIIMVMDQKYVGACPAGVEPGDRVNADGTVLHLKKR